MNYQKVREICEILELEDIEEFKEYLQDMDVKKSLDVYEQLKERTNVRKAINLLQEITDLVKLTDSEELLEGLLDDDDLLEYSSNKYKSKNKFVMKIYETQNNTKGKNNNQTFLDDDDDDYSPKEEKESSNSELYTEDQEKAVLKKFTLLRRKLYLYITFYKDNNSSFKEFYNYIEDLRAKRNPKIEDEEEIEPLEVTIIGELFRETNEPPIANIKKNKKIMEIVDKAKEIRDDIHMHNTGLVKKTALKWQNRGLPFDDLYQEGSIGLDKAINRFDINYGNKFSTYATWWIKQAISRAVAGEGTTIRLPAHIYETERIIRPAVKQLRYRDENEDPTSEEIYRECQKLGIDKITLNKIIRYKRAKQICNPTSVDQYVGEDEDTSLIEFLSNENEERPEDYAEKLNTVDRINNVLKNMYEEGSKIRYDKAGRPTNQEVYKKIVFYETTGKKIRVILTSKEYDYHMVEATRIKKKRLKELINKYGLTNINLSSGYITEDITKTITKTNKDGKEYSVEEQYKEMCFETKDGDVRLIEVPLKEYNYYIEEPLKMRKERIMEFFDKYHIDTNLLTSSINVTNIIYTIEQRNILVYSLRKKIKNFEAQRFIEGRNYNDALYETNIFDKRLTLEKCGLLFGLTRERIRQVESKLDRSVNAALNKTVIREIVSRDVYIGNEILNVYDMLKVTNNGSYLLLAPVNDAISVDQNGNITLLHEGRARIQLKNRRDGTIRLLELNVKPSIIAKHNYDQRLILRKLNNNKKDNQ